MTITKCKKCGCENITSKGEHTTPSSPNTSVLIGQKETLKRTEIMMKINLEYEYLPKQEEVRKHIQECEGRHTQQAIYSTFHDALTQVCFGCLKVRSTIKR